MPWKDVQGHTTWYEDNFTEGCFPLCEECWEILGSPEARIEYYAALLAKWEADGATIPPDKRRAIGQAVANGG